MKILNNLTTDLFQAGGLSAFVFLWSPRFLLCVDVRVRISNMIEQNDNIT